MRSHVTNLVVLMVLMACSAVVNLHPPGIYRQPGNLLVGAGLLGGAVAVALRRRRSYALGMIGAGFAVLGGLLSLRNLVSTALPGYPILWIGIGLYLMLRLSLNLHAEKEALLKARAKDRQKTFDDAQQDG